MSTARSIRQPRAQQVAGWQAREKRNAALRAAKRAKAEGFVYLIVFSSGTVKVGKTARPEGRVKDHQRSAEAHGVNIDRVWVSKKHGGYEDSEQELIGFCRDSGTPITGSPEHFTGIAGDELQGLLAFAHLVSTNRARKAYLARLVAAVNGDMGATWEEAQAALDGGTST